MTECWVTSSSPLSRRQIGRICADFWPLISRPYYIVSRANYGTTGREEQMKSDDPELEKRRQEMIERAQNMDALILSVLKTHLLTEKSMEDYILASGFKKRWLNKRFSEKLAKCRVLAQGEDKDPLWDVLVAANDLRNKIAHTLEIAEIKKKMAILKEKYFAGLTQRQVDGLKDQPDDFIALSACSTCAGFIATLQSRIPPKPA
jgi:hypothetical protein